MLFSLRATAQNERLKALFILNFAKNVEWPEEYRSGDFVITVLGNSALYGELKKNVDGKKIGIQTIVVNHISTVAGIKKCNILFIPLSNGNLVEAAQRQLAGKATLIVSERKTLTIKEGADINLSQTGGRLQYEIKPKQISAKGMRPSPTLLNLGLIYDGSVQRRPKLESVEDVNTPR